LEKKFYECTVIETMKLVKTSARSFTVQLTSMLPGLPYPNGTHEMKKDLQIIEHTQNHHNYIA
jgi:hypothetical protein